MLCAHRAADACQVAGRHHVAVIALAVALGAGATYFEFSDRFTAIIGLD